jgi:hypothetical protein
VPPPPLLLLALPLLLPLLALALLLLLWLLLPLLSVLLPREEVPGVVLEVVSGEWRWGGLTCSPGFHPLAYPKR